jgi:hypothetical protein
MTRRTSSKREYVKPIAVTETCGLGLAYCCRHLLPLAPDINKNGIHDADIAVFMAIFVNIAESCEEVFNQFSKAAC